MTAISGKQRRYLRSLAHHLDPVVIIGQQGITPAAVRQIDTALTDHELIKVKLSRECPVDRYDAAGLLTEQTGCVVAGIVGRVLCLYRARPDDPLISLP